MPYRITYINGSHEDFDARSEVSKLVKLTRTQWAMIEAGTVVKLNSLKGAVKISRVEDARPTPLTKQQMTQCCRIMADIISRGLIEDRYDYTETDLGMCYRLTPAQAAYLRKLIIASM